MIHVKVLLASIVIVSGAALAQQAAPMMRAPAALAVQSTGGVPLLTGSAKAQPLPARIKALREWSQRARTTSAEGQRFISIKGQFKLAPKAVVISPAAPWGSLGWIWAYALDNGEMWYFNDSIYLTSVSGNYHKSAIVFDLVPTPGKRYLIDAKYATDEPQGACEVTLGMFTGSATVKSPCGKDIQHVVFMYKTGEQVPTGGAEDFYLTATPGVTLMFYAFSVVPVD